MPSGPQLFKGLGVVGAAVCLSMAGAPAVAVGVVLTASADSIVLDGSSTVNPFPGLLASELGTSGAGTVWLSVLKFDLTPVVGMRINSASVELTTIFNHNSGAFSHQMYSSGDDSWSESTVNGVNRPAESTLHLLSATTINGTSAPYTWNVLSGVTGSDGLGGSGVTITFLVRPDLSQAASVFGPHFNDRTAASGVPRLLLDVSPVPEPPAWMLWSIGAFVLWPRLRTCWRAVAPGSTARSG